MPIARLALLLMLAAVGTAECAAPPVAEKPAASDTDWELYGARLRAAYRAWELGRASEAWRELEDCRWDLRGWEHRHLCALLMRHQAILSRDNSFSWASFTPDGNILTSTRGGPSLHDGRTFEPVEATARLSLSGAGTTIRIQRGPKAVVRSWVAHRKPISAAELSGDGRLIATGSVDGTAILWDAASGEERFRLTGHTERVDSFAFSEDGSRLVAASLHLIRVWDTRTGRPVAERDGNNVCRAGAALSPDGRRVLSAGDTYDAALFWDANTGRELKRFRANGARLTALALCPDGMTAATGHEDGAIRLWETRTGRLLETFRGHEENRRGGAESVGRLSFSPEGARLLSSGSDGTVRMWDARPAPAVTEYYKGFQTSGVVNRILGVKGSRFVNLSFPIGFGSGIPSGGILSAWDIEKGHRLYLHDGSGRRESRCFALSPDGKLLAAGEGSGAVTIRDAATGKPVRGFGGGPLSAAVVAVAWSPDGRRIASATPDGGVQVRDASTGKTLQSFTGPESVTRLAYSPDGTLLACGGGHAGRVLDTRTGATRFALPRLDQFFPDMVFSPDGSRLLVRGENESAGFDGRTGKPLPVAGFYMGRSSHFTYSPDGSRLLDWGYVTLRVREGKSGRILLTLPTEGRDAFAFGTDGRLYSAGGLALAPLREGRAGRDARVLEGSDGLDLYGLVANRDGSVVARRTGGPELMAWDARTGKLLLRDMLGDQRSDLWFTRDGKTLVARSLTKPKSPVRHWIVQPGGKPPHPGDALEWPVAPKLAGGYRLEARRGRIALIHADTAAEDRAPMTRWAKPDIAWHLRRLADATADGDDRAADHHLRFLLRDPVLGKDAKSYLRRARVLARLGRPWESAASLAWALLLDPRVPLDEPRRAPVAPPSMWRVPDGE